MARRQAKSMGETAKAENAGRSQRRCQLTAKAAGHLENEGTSCDPRGKAKIKKVG